MRSLKSLWNFQPGERRLVTLLFVEYFFIGVTSAFTQSGVFALFLAEFGSQGLPYSYVSAAIGASAIAFLYLKLTERVSLSSSLIVNLGGLALGSALIRVGLGQPDPHWVVFILPVWFQVIANLSALALWTLAARLFDVRQGKRLFGLIGAGNWLAVAAGGFVVAPVVAWLGTPNLFFLSALALVIASACQFAILRENAGRLTTPAHAGSPARPAWSAPHPAQNRYLISILAVVALVWIAFFFIDNIFYDAAASQISDVNQLASFIGTLNAAIGILGLVMTISLTGPVIRRLGVGTSLLILPGILTVTMALLAVTGTLTQVGVIIFALAAFSKTIDVALTFTLDLSSRAILYQALPSRERVRVQTIADGIVQPISIGIAGILLLIFNTWLSFTAVQLAVLFVVIGTAWLFVAFGLRREYPRTLAQALAKRHLGENATPLTDRASISLLRNALKNPNTGTVLYAVNLLADQELETLEKELPDLLAHLDPRVRRDALDRIERLGLKVALPAVRARLTDEPTDELRGAAIRTFARLGGESERLVASEWLADPSPQVRSGVIVGLIGGDTAKAAAAERALEEMVASSLVPERRIAAEILARAEIPEREQLILSLLQDGDVSVQRAALRAVAAVPFPQGLEWALNVLGTRSLRGTAILTLAAGSPDVLPKIERAFRSDKPDPTFLSALAQVCGKIGTPEAVALLVDQMNAPYSAPRTASLSALSRLGYRATGQEAARVQSQIRAEVSQAAVRCGQSVDLGDDPPLDLTHRALAAEISAAQDRVFFLLSFLYDRASILNARANLNRANPEKRAYALEVLDLLLSHDLKMFVLPLVEHATPGACLAALASVLPQPHRDRATRLRELAHDSDSTSGHWLALTARYAAHRFGIPGLEPLAEKDLAMLSTIEKLIILKGVDLFAETPDPVLADVAQACREVEVAPGEAIFAKGEPGDSLYVIVAGKVRVHDGSVTLSELGDAEVFGEMALLDPEPRSASVTAEQETRLLQLAKEPFQELLDEQSEIARSVIKVLTRRLRARTQDLANAVAPPAL